MLNLKSIAIHCNTEEKASILMNNIDCRCADIWVNFWNNYKGSTCYFINENGNLDSYCSKKYFEKNGVKIIGFYDALNKIKQETNNIDNIIRINGNNFTDYDKAIDYIEKLKDKEIAKWFFHDANLYGIGYAILKWCKANDKYYNENILKSAIDEYSVTAQMVGSNFANDVLRIYNKILELPRYRGLVFKGLER